MTAPAVPVDVPDTVPPEWVDEACDDGDDSLIHKTCCDPDVALCGEPLDDAEDVPDGADGKRCVICVRIDELGYPCGVLFCSLRRWWSARWPL